MFCSLVTFLFLVIKYASMLSNTHDFKANNNSTEIIKIKENLSSAALLLTKINNEHYLSTKAKAVLSDKLNLIKQIEKKINPKVGCYIATQLYGNYDTLEVVLLRHFRDTVLNKVYFGRIAIKVYYYLSPKLLAKFQKQSILLNILDKVIRLILNKILLKYHKNSVK